MFRFKIHFVIQINSFQGILLVYDITNKWSFDGIARWIKEIDEVKRDILSKCGYFHRGKLIFCYQCNMFGLVEFGTCICREKELTKICLLYICIVYMCFFFFENVPMVINFVKLLLYSFPHANKSTFRVTVVQSVVQIRSINDL